jgi:hypothetical protein
MGKGPKQANVNAMRGSTVVVLNWINGFMVLPFFFPAALVLFDCGSGRGEEPQRGENPPPDSDPFGFKM